MRDFYSRYHRFCLDLRVNNWRCVFPREHRIQHVAGCFQRQRRDLVNLPHNNNIGLSRFSSSTRGQMLLGELVYSVTILTMWAN